MVRARRCDSIIAEDRYWEGRAQLIRRPREFIPPRCGNAGHRERATRDSVHAALSLLANRGGRSPQNLPRVDTFLRVLAVYEERDLPRELALGALFCRQPGSRVGRAGSGPAAAPASRSRSGWRRRLEPRCLFARRVAGLLRRASWDSGRDHRGFFWSAFTRRVSSARPLLAIIDP